MNRKTITFAEKSIIKHLQKNVMIKVRKVVITHDENQTPTKLRDTIKLLVERSNKILV